MNLFGGPHGQQPISRGGPAVLVKVSPTGEKAESTEKSTPTISAALLPRSLLKLSATQNASEKKRVSARIVKSAQATTLKPNPMAGNKERICLKEAPNATLSGRGATTFQETSKPLRVGLNDWSSCELESATQPTQVTSNRRPVPSGRRLHVWISGRPCSGSFS